MRGSEKRTQHRKPRIAPEQGGGAGGRWGDEIRERLRALIRVEGGSNRAFARRCGLTASRVSEWLGGEQLLSLARMRDIAERTGVSLDWLVMGECGSEPVYRAQSRTQKELELDLAVAVRREIHRREAEGAFDLNGTHTRMSEESWWVDGRGVLQDAIDAEVLRVREWIKYEEETKALAGIADDILAALVAIVPHLPAKDTDLGKRVYQLGSAAQEARDIRSTLKPPKEANAYRGLSARLSSVPVVGSEQALGYVKGELAAEHVEDPNPLWRRLQDGSAVFAPVRKLGKE